LSRTVTSGFTSVNKRLDSIIVSQSSIDNAVTVVSNLLTDLSNDNQTILADLTAIQSAIANGQPVDTTALDAVVGRVQNVQAGIDSAVTSLTDTANPTPPVTPTA
jgi:fructose-specific phosphotransferase system IIC component